MMKTLSEHLYLRNLDNDAGVFHHLPDAAEDSQVKETLLAFHFPHTAERPLTAAELDRRVEDWFGRRRSTTFDFQVSGGVRTLDEPGLLALDADGALDVPRVEAAVTILKRRWDDVFPAHTVTEAV